jgi:hypothetical protein
MGRSPGAVLRMISMAWSTSARRGEGDAAAAIDVRGKESPEPRSSVIAVRTYPMLISAAEMSRCPMP